MEQNNAENTPIQCANGCGFYGSPINNNMCSKCFKEVSQKNGMQVDTPATRLAEKTATQLTAAVSAAASSSAVNPAAAAPSTTTTTTTISHVQAPAPVPTPTPTSQPLPAIEVMAVAPETLTASAPDSPAPGERPVQLNKGRCYMCRAKIPLAKQAINKCRCEFVFCDTHKASTKHDCEFDFAKMGKDLLAKNNPKLNDRPRGGRSFTRIQDS